MVLVLFLCQNVCAQNEVICEGISGCILEVASDPSASLYVLSSEDCTINDTSTDRFFSADNLAGDYCYHTVSFSDGSAAAVAQAIATGCTDDLIALGDGNADITVNQFCNVSIVSYDCASFDVIPSAICSPPNANGDREYQILLVISGGDPGNNGYMVTDDQTGQSFGPIAGPSISYGPFAAGTGFSYTVSVSDNPTCTVTVSESIVDCTTTGLN